jgi:Domain of unknown function (DUF5103)
MNLYRFLLLIGGFMLAHVPLRAQDDLNYDAILDEDIRSVLMNSAASTPVVNLKGGSLLLEFDHIGYDIQDYVFTIQHYNSDWTRSELEDIEYIDGILEDRITDIQSSINTLQPYTHYRLKLDFRSTVRWTVSGNYILKIMDEDDDRAVVMTRRFMVSEGLWGVDNPRMVPVVDPIKLFTHQELDFNIRHDNFTIGNPQREVKTYILQNMRWDRSIGPLMPNALPSPRGGLNYDYQNTIVFPAGKQWRYFDIRSIEVRLNNVHSLYRKDGITHALLRLDQDRYDQNFFDAVDDLNGYFAIENRNANVLQDRVPLQSRGASDMTNDYAKVWFSLKRNAPYDDHDVYVYGALTDWKLRDEYKMVYDEASHTYGCSALLKQGYYNYQFMVIKKGTWDPDPAEDLEGNWHFTTNHYNILVYYRQFGERYDRLMGTGGVESLRN